MVDVEISNIAFVLGNPSKKKCGKFHIWGEGGSGPGHFPHFKKKKKVVFKMHFKPF